MDFGYYAGNFKIFFYENDSSILMSAYVYVAMQEESGGMLTMFLRIDCFI